MILLRDEVLLCRVRSPTMRMVRATIEAVGKEFQVAVERVEPG
jgi:hypothetical protein